jgi:hypothetical protein
MTETFTLLVAERDDELRDELVGQLLADGYQANPARTAAQAGCRAGYAPDPLLLGELDDPTARCRCCASCARATRSPRGPTHGCP